MARTTQRDAVGGWGLDWGLWIGDGGLPQAGRLVAFTGGPLGFLGHAQRLAQEAGGGGAGCGNRLGGALRHEPPPVRAGFRAEVENPIGGFDDVEVVLDDQQGMAGCDEFLKHA